MEYQCHKTESPIHNLSPHVPFKYCTISYSLVFKFLTYSIYLQWVEEPTLLVTRFEYANLFHTVTDWYAAYVASRVTGLPYRPHLVFVDGHCMVSVLSFTSLQYLVFTDRNSSCWCRGDCLLANSLCAVFHLKIFHVF